LCRGSSDPEHKRLTALGRRGTEHPALGTRPRETEEKDSDDLRRGCARHAVAPKSNVFTETDLQ
jgi:hypothetical protein